MVIVGKMTAIEEREVSDTCTVHTIHVEAGSVLLTPDSTPTKSGSECSEDDAVTHIKSLPVRLTTANGDTGSGGSACGSEGEEEGTSRRLVRCQSDTVLDSPKPSKAKLVKADRPSRQVSSSKPPKPGMLKSAPAKPTRRKRATKDSKKSSKATDKRRSSSVPAPRHTEQKNALMTDFFPVRRSARVPKSKLKEQDKKDLERKVLLNCEEGLEVVEITGKGRGVVSTREFARGDFVVEYHGKLISVDQAKSLEDHYSAKPDVGCYMYYFRFNNKCFCIDATAESGRLGRLLNHSKLQANCSTRVIGINGVPYLILVASRHIQEGEELLYDYGDRSKESLEAHPWLKL